jgi:hypothetical protein
VGAANQEHIGSALPGDSADKRYELDPQTPAAMRPLAERQGLTNGSHVDLPSPEKLDIGDSVLGREDGGSRQQYREFAPLHL